MDPQLSGAARAGGGRPGGGHPGGGRVPFPREPAPLSSLARLTSYPWLVVSVACLAAFAGQVDASIVQLGLPTLEREFDASLDKVSWVAVAYGLSFAAILPVYARLAEIGGRKVMYICGFALFGLFSALCGFAPSLPWLIAFRALQGMSGALLGANSVVIAVTTVGTARRGRAIGLIAGAQAVGVSAGPALGGLLLDGLSWHWIFWVTVPIAILGAVLGWLLVPLSTPVSSKTSFDWPGALLLIPALTAVMITMTELHAWGPASPGILACGIGAAVLLTAFVRRERATAAPLLDPVLFRSRAFCGGCVAVVLSYAMLYGMFFAMSFALVRAYHDTSLAAGLTLTMVPIALGLVAPFSGGLADRWPRRIMLSGAALCVLALIALSQLLTSRLGGAAGLLAALVVYGAGLGLFIAPNNSATLAAASGEHAGQASGLLNLLRAFGTATGVAAASTLMTWRLELSTGVSGRTTAVGEHALLGAVEDTMLMLAGLAVIAGIASCVRDRPGPAVRP